MDVRDKLRKYLEENGIQSKWFAEKIGINLSLFYQVLHKHKPIPKKYWTSIILMTNRKITLNDLAEIDEDFENKKYKKKSKK